MIHGINGNTKAILTLPAIAVALLLAGASQQATAGEAAAITNNNPGMGIKQQYDRLPPAGAACEAETLDEASSRINSKCDLDCVVEALPDDPGLRGGSRNVDTVVQLARECSGSEEKRLFKIGTMEQAWLDAVLQEENGEKLLRDYLGIASNITALERNDPDSPVLEARRTKAEALKEELMAVNATVIFEGGGKKYEMKVREPAKATGLGKLVLEIRRLNIYDIQRFAESR